MDKALGITPEILLGAIIVMAVIMLVVTAELFYMRVQLRLKQERYYWLLGASGMYLFEYDEGTDELVLSTPFAELLGVPALIPQASQVIEHSRDRELQQRLAYITKIMNEQGLSRITIDLPTTHGIYSVRYNTFYDKQNKPASHIGILSDITNDVLAEERLRTKAERDGLTGVYNSETIRSLIAGELSSYRPDSPAAFIMLDIDHFKGINDTYGHQAGDAVLQALAATLRNSVREYDIVGRLGGDEFCIYLRQVPSYSFLCDLCSRLNAAARNVCVPCEQVDIRITISIGGVMVLRGDIFSSIYKRADKMLYMAKEAGRNGYCATP